MTSIWIVLSFYASRLKHLCHGSVTVTALHTFHSGTVQKHSTDFLKENFHSSACTDPKFNGQLGRSEFQSDKLMGRRNSPKPEFFQRHSNVHLPFFSPVHFTGVALAVPTL